MTAEEMRTGREHGESKTDLELLRRNQSAGIEPEDDEDAPDASTAIRETIARRRVGCPAGSGNKEQVAIRFDKDVLEAIHATGRGWQTRMNDALRTWLKEHTVG